MKDLVILGIMLVAFASVVTIHVTIAYGLARRRPRWHALVALALAPTAPYLAWRAEMPKRAGLWVFGVLVYLVTLLISSH